MVKYNRVSDEIYGSGGFEESPLPEVKTLASKKSVLVVEVQVTRNFNAL